MPIIYKVSDQNSIEVILKDSNTVVFNSLSLDENMSASVFNRTGVVLTIRVNIKEDYLK